jgi:hypothetical protein
MEIVKHRCRLSWLEVWPESLHFQWGPWYSSGCCWTRAHNVQPCLSRIKSPFFTNFLCWVSNFRQYSVFNLQLLKFTYYLLKMKEKRKINPKTTLNGNMICIVCSGWTVHGISFCLCTTGTGSAHCNRGDQISWSGNTIKCKLSPLLAHISKWQWFIGFRVIC